MADETRPSKPQYLFLAGEPLDEPHRTLDHRRRRQGHHRQLLADRNRLAVLALMPGLDMKPVKFGSLGLPDSRLQAVGYRRHHRRGHAAGREGILAQWTK